MFWISFLVDLNCFEDIFLENIMVLIVLGCCLTAWLKNITPVGRAKKSHRQCGIALIVDFCISYMNMHNVFWRDCLVHTVF